MSAREIAATLPKNYHTTRSLLRKMEDAGEVKHSNGRYLAVSTGTGHCQWPPLHGNKHKEQQEKQQPTRNAAIDYNDDSDYGDDVDYTDGISHDSFTEICNCSEGTAVQETSESISVRVDPAEGQQEHNQREHTVINRHHRNQCHHCNHRNQFHQQTVAEGVRGASSDGTDTTTQEEHKDATLQRNRCPHHPQAQLVRFDPAGQAWCDKMDCWDCYRLMKIGEALDYHCLTDLGGKVVIDQGMPAWSTFVLTQRAFLVVVATEQAIVLCKEMGIEVPDVSGEVKRLVEVHSSPP